MKRTSLDLETNMAPPTAKRVCMETVPDMPADPTTPIDDFDDLYDDSPVIHNHREKSPQRSSEKITVQQSNLNLLATSFQLPGLGLFASKENNPEQEANAEKEPVLPHNATSLPPVGELSEAQNLLQTEGEPPPELHGTRQNHVHSGGQIGSPIVDEPDRSKGLDATGARVFEVSPQGQTSTEEQQRVEGSESEAISQIEGRCDTLEQPSIDRSAADTQTSQWAAGVAGEEPQENLERITRSDPLGVSEQDSPQQGGETKYVGASQTLTGEQDGDKIANEEPEIQNEDRNTLVPPPSTDSVRKDDTSEQRVDKLALQTLQDNIEADPHRDVDTSTTLSKNSDVHQAAPTPQVDMEDTTKAEKDQTLEEVATSNMENGEAEFELDSSPIETSSESGSESSSSSSGESDYHMLDPAEEARRLMQEDGGSDDEGKGGKASSGPLRTLNEKPDEIVPKPQVEITPEMTISELGRVEHVVENSILIKGKTSGESRALESGSLLCLGDRSIIGVIAELLGQVQQPYYSVRFTNPAAIAEVGILKGTLIFYVEQHSSYIFTQSLKALKGSDASNIHDEEVGDDELEFSDDEAEAEHKRRAKQERQARRAGREEWNDSGARRGRTDQGGRNDRGGRGNRGDGYSKGPRRGHLQGEGRGHFHQTDSRDTSSPIMNYDDNDDGDDLYTPLARPPNLHEIMGRGEAPQESLNDHVNGNPGVQRFQRGGGRSERGRGRGDRGRGDRGRGTRGGRGDWGQRGGFNRDSRLERYDSQGQQHHSQRPPSPRHNSSHPSFPPPFNAASAPSSHGWPNQMQLDHPSGSPIPSYQQPLYMPPQQANHPSYPSNTYGQSQYPYPSPQAQSPQTYNPPQYTTSYQTTAPPTSPVPPNIPAGAHINPAFFSPPAPQAWLQQQQNYSGNNNTPSQPSGGEGNRTSQSQEAFQAAQERLDLLRQLTRSAAGSSSG